MTDEDGQQAESEKPRRTWTTKQRQAWARRQQGGRPRAQQHASDAELVAEAVVGEAVANVKAVGAMFITPIAPHTGFTLVGVPSPGYEPDENAWQVPPRPEDWIVRSRADAIGRALLPQAQRNARLLAVLDRFNAALRSVEVIEAAGAIVASVAIDARIAPPDAAVLLPGGIQYPIFGAVVGDTIEYVRLITGGPEPEHTRQEQRPRAESAAAGARPGSDSTVRDEGQQVVSGGVTAT